MIKSADPLHFGMGKRRLTSFTFQLVIGPILSFLFVAIYALAFLRSFPLLTWYKTPQATFASLTHGSYLAAIGLSIACLGLVILCKKSWTVARDRPGRSAVIFIWAGWLGASAILLLTYPGQSTDLGDYAFRAHMLVHLGKNPMTTSPNQVIAFENYPYLAWYTTVDYYGPIWQGLAGSAHLIAGEGLLANLIAFKVIAILSIAVSGGFIHAILRRINPRHAEAGLALWLWNPLVLNEGALHGHNDLVLVAIMLAGLWLVLKGRQTSGVVTLLAAGLVKANIWILIPVVAIWILRQWGWRKALSTMALALLTGVIIIWLAYLPFGGWIRLLDLAYQRSWWPTNTWTAAIFFTLRDKLGWAHELVVKQVSNNVTWLCGGILLIVMLKIRDLLTCLWAAILAYLLIGCHWFQPWYATWLIAITALTVNPRLVNYALLFTWFMLLHPIVAQFVVGPLHLPPWDYSLAMAASTLLAPQIMALRLIVSPRVKSAPSKMADSLNL